MSSCANIINRLTRDVCNIQNELSHSECMRGVMELNQVIFRREDTLAYLVEDNEQNSVLCGIPVNVNKTYDGCERSGRYLLVNSSVNPQAILVNTDNLHSSGKRDCTGFFCFCKTLNVCVEKVDLDVLVNLDQALLVEALQNCSNTTCNGTLTLEAYNALSAVLRNYGINNIRVNQAACIYKFLMRNADKTEDNVEPAEPAEPAEPGEPGEPSDNYPDVQVRQLADSTVSDSTTSAEQIEAKLRSLLEQTETNTE